LADDENFHGAKSEKTPSAWVDRLAGGSGLETIREVYQPPTRLCSEFVGYTVPLKNSFLLKFNEAVSFQQSAISSGKRRTLIILS
jgi:hypothetical protein